MLRLFFLLKNRFFWPSYCQISTGLDKILHTHLIESPPSTHSGDFNALTPSYVHSYSYLLADQVIAEKPFQNSGVTRRLWPFQHVTVLERNIWILSYSFDISINDLYAGYTATRWRNLLSNLPKNADLDIARCSAVCMKYSVSKQGGEVFLQCTLLHVKKVSYRK